MSNERTVPATGPRRARGRPPATARREQIVDAALEEFAEHGFHNSSLAAVAERVGLSQQGLLHHFPTKESLLISVLSRRDEIDDAEFGELSDLDRLRDVVERNTGRPGVVRLYTLLSAEGLAEDHPAGDYFTERFAALRVRLADALRAAHGDRLAGGATPEQAATLLIAAMDGLQLQWSYAPGAVDMPDLMGVLTDVLRGGETGDRAD
ncbi:TetR/AcrR family transcriptional regulator [Nocardiopsis lambiniae]|uniref:TetR family transcriptional regulator n=1 Tax=Nocardiopsis lambiniae TaxID=3075539 RepID=A0ABU2M5Q8_9ACTN|nr:TetR family transcriptional regulator [Nocardiopsis sp. DSM 44743]MDT0327909.1 TetR family transcriptional regulator [Nocardiopsis sp. DSM 44743]